MIPLPAHLFFFFFFFRDGRSANNVGQSVRPVMYEKMVTYRMKKFRIGVVVCLFFSRVTDHRDDRCALWLAIEAIRQTA